MGRPSNGVPYLKGGVYHIRFKGDKGGGTSLNTTNARQAKALAEGIARKRGVTMPSLVTGGQPSAAPRPTLMGSPIGGASGAPGADASADTGAPVRVGSDALDSWLGSSSEFEGQAGYEPPAGGSGAPATSQEPLSLSPTSPGLTSDERTKLHGLLSGIVGRANVLALGLGCRVFGRIPAEPEPADLELLNRAWQLQLEELLGDKELKPWMMICGASAGLAIGMYAGGEPLPPKLKKGQEAPQAPLSSMP